MSNIASLNKEIVFKFDEYNPRRDFRGVEAARVYISYDEGKTWEWLWMNKLDIRKNIMEFGRHGELLKALNAYERKEEICGLFRKEIDEQNI